MMVTLEQLPDTVLDNIFQYVSSADLLKLCCLSRSFYCSALSRIYHSITITDRKNASWANRNLELWKVNHGTAMDSMKLRKLLNSITQSHFLASLVRSLVIEKYTEPFQDALEIVFNKLPALTSVYDHVGCLPKEKRERVWEKVSCSIDHVPSFTSQNLMELKLVTPRERLSLEEYRRLARNMIQSGSYTNLKKLVFFSEKDSQETEMLHSCPHKCEASWFGFFDEFSKAGIKLNLDYLGLNGETYDKAGYFVEAISIAVDLKNLSALELSTTEEEHRRPAEEAPTFLETLTALTPLLEYLSIQPTGHYWAWQMDSICTTLYEIIPNQLKHLEITIIPEDSRQIEFLKLIIWSGQRNLVKLKIDDGLVFDCEESSTKDVFLCINRHGRDAAENEERRRRLFPRIAQNEHPTPRILKRHAKLIRRHAEDIYHSFKSDDINQDSSNKLPHLEEYWVGGLNVNMKGRGIIVNNYTVSFAHFEQECSG